MKLHLTVEVDDAEALRFLRLLSAHDADPATPEDVAAAVAATEEKPKRTRRTKAEIEAAKIEDAAIRGHVEEPAIEPATAVAEGGLFDMLTGEPIEDTTPYAGVTREELLDRARARAKAVGGRDWLVQNVLCGHKFPNMSAVPDSVLAAALAQEDIREAA